MSRPEYFLRSILALSQFALPAVAQSTFTVTPSQIPGVQVYGPDTPEFAKHLSDLAVETKTRADGAAYLSRAIVVINSTNRPIAKFVVRFDYLNAAGEMIAENQWQEPYQPFEPGAVRLITVSGGVLAEAIRSHWPADLIARTTRIPERDGIARSPLIRASVDSVLFTDGDFFGPDVAGAWGRLIAEQEFVRSTRTELERLGRDMEEIQRRLQEIRKPVPGTLGGISLLRAKIFGTLILSANGGYEPFLAMLEAAFGEKTLTVLQRKF